MKKPLLYIGSVFIFILAAVAFVFVPAKMGDSNPMDSVTFGKYDGKPIELKPGTEFANAVNNIKNNYERNGYPIDESQYFYVYSYAFNTAIQAIVSKSEVAKSGYEPSDREVSRQILKLPYFLNEEGKYDPKIAALYSDEQKNELRASVKESLTQSRFNEDLFGSADELGGKRLFGLKSNDKENEFIANIGATKRSFSVISFDKSNYPVAEVIRFADENKDLFNKFNLSAITFADESTAKKVLSQIKNNEISFEDAVKEEFSEKNYTDNDGKITAAFQYNIKGILADESSLETINALAQDSYSDVIKTASGYTVFRKDGVTTPSDLSNVDTIDVIKKYIASNESTRVEDYFTTVAKNVTANAKLDGFENVDVDSIEGASKTESVEFALNYGGVSVASKIPTDVKPLAAATNNEHFWEVAFGLKLEEYSEPIVLGNYVVVLKYNSKTVEQADSTKLDSVKSDIASYDQSAAYSTILNSDKIENNVWNAYAKLHMNNRE